MIDHYATLGVGREATAAEIANAYRQLLLRERQERGEQADFGAYSLAYRTLINQAKRAEYDRFLDELSGKYSLKDPESPTEAERCYLAGLTCMEQKNFQDAVDYLYRAVQLEPDNSHFCSQLGLALGMFKDRLAEAERYCKKAISLDPDNPDFRFNLGFLYQRHNLVDAAQTSFDLANEAIRSRQARMLRENEPLITPWGDEGQDLLNELSRLESMMDEVEKPDKAAEPPLPADSNETLPPLESKNKEPVLPTPGSETTVIAPQELVTESDLLRQLDDLQTQASKLEVAEALASTADQNEPPMEKFLDDDLLKELDLLEAQVRGVEEFHNGEQEKEDQSLTEEKLATRSEGPSEAQPVATEGPEPTLPMETTVSQISETALESMRPVETELAKAEDRPIEMAASGVQEPATDQVDLEVPKEETLAALPSGETAIDLPESLIQQDSSRITLPEALQAPEETIKVPEPVADLAAAPAATRSALAEGPAAVETLRAEPEMEERPQSHRLAEGAAGDKIRMLEELEREMLDELEMIRKEKERLQASV